MGITKRFVAVACLLTFVLVAGCAPGPVFVPVPTSAALTPAPVAATSQSGAFYRDPQARFSVPVPVNWQAEARDGYGLLTSPEAKIKVYVLAVEGADIEAAIAAAWQKVEPGFDLPQDQVVDSPPTRGVEKTVSIVYDTGQPPSEIVIAGGDLYQGTIYLMLVRGELVAFQQRQAQVTIIGSGYDIAALEKVDLSAAQALKLTPEMLADLEAYIQEAMRRFEIPAAEVAVVQGGKIVYAQGFGRRGPDTDQPVTPETLMMIGSTTKTMTTMMMATLVDDGKMQWDTPVAQILPGFAVKDPALSRQITVRNLVCACTGVPRRDLELMFNIKDMTAEAVVDSLKTFEFFTGFGEAFQYSNQMVAAGGYVAAAAASGQTGDLYATYEQELRRRVIEPIGMVSTTLSFDQVRAGGNYALPHGMDLAGKLVPITLGEEAFVTPIAPAGAAWSNVKDMGRYLITLLNQGVAPDGRRVVSRENLQTTFEPQVPVSAETSYGLGWMVDKYKGQPLLHHGGNTMGFTSDLAFLPEAGLGISVLANGRLTNVFNEAVRYYLLETVFGQPHETDAQMQFAWEQMQKSAQETIDKLQDSLDAKALEPYLGASTSDALGQIKLSLADGRLMMDAGEFAAELRAMVDDGVTYYVTYDAPFSGLPLQLKVDTRGQPTVVLGAGAIEYTFTKTE
jgi:CubicO group peptidase (beta-lactamase class C family)